MKKEIILGVCVFLLLSLIYFKFYRKYSKFNTSPVKICDPVCSTYNVHNLHQNKEGAAKLMETITNRVDILMNHLLEKYGNARFNSIDPDKSNRIDVIPSIISGNDFIEGATDKEIANKEYMEERVMQLFERYNKEAIYEISPLNKANLTSYTENKGEQLVLCLREKKAVNGENRLHDPNTMMFVVCHELTHIMNDAWGHETEFWELFKTMLENAIECGVYSPVNYRLYPINYCGLELNYNPLFDVTLDKARGSEEMIVRPHWEFSKLI